LESSEKNVTVLSLCKAANMSRNNWYKGRSNRQKKKVDESLVVELVKRERLIQPRLGGRKLLQILKAELKEAGVHIGRDLFFAVLCRNNLLVPPPKKSCRTTDSRHSMPVFNNLVKDREITSVNQVWVSDITYIRTEEGFVFLSSIMDRYSRKIVGYCCADSLEAEGCLNALDQALASLPKNNKPIHHSDRGCQYCCHAYVDRLKSRGLGISMTQENHCAENAFAERLNGILKQEYALNMTFKSKNQAYKAVQEAVWLYNNKRPHTRLDMQKPEEVYQNAA
jgi:transposase InsO family protein